MVDALETAFRPARADWRFVKIHYLLHYSFCIIRTGAPSEYSAQLWKMAHKRNMKDVFKVSSRHMRYFTRFATEHHDMAGYTRLKNLRQPSSTF